MGWLRRERAATGRSAWWGTQGNGALSADEEKPEILLADDNADMRE